LNGSHFFIIFSPVNFFANVRLWTLLSRKNISETFIRGNRNSQLLKSVKFSLFAHKTPSQRKKHWHLLPVLKTKLCSRAILNFTPGTQGNTSTPGVKFVP
jgi:hypothetical protein